MAITLAYFQENPWKLNTVVAFYLIMFNGILRNISHKKNKRILRLVYILNTFYIFAVMSNVYFIRLLKNLEIEDVTNIGIIGFKLKTLGMVETLLLAKLERTDAIDVIHVMDCCLIITFITIFSFGNSKLFCHIVSC